MAADSTYPVALPGPVRCTMKSKDRARTPSLPGAPSFRAANRDFSGLVELEFFLTSEQADAWYTWWKTDTLEGGYAFNADWPKVSSTLGVYRFNSTPVFTHVYDGAYRITVTAQCRGRSITVQPLDLDVYYNHPTKDPYWAFVSLLLSGGATGSTALQDSSPYAANFAVAGSAVLSSGATKFAQASIHLPDTAAGWSTPNHLGVQLQSLDFTVEFWVYLTAAPASDFLLFGARDATGTGRWSVLVNSGRSAAFQVDSTSFVTTPSAIPLNQWTHVAFCRNGNTIQSFIDGTAQASAAFSSVIGTTSAFRVGDEPSFAGFQPVYLEEIRVTKGVCRYITSFQIPLSAYPALLQAPTKTAKLVSPASATGVTVTAPTTYTHRVQATAAAAANYYTAWLQTDDCTGKKYIEFVNEGSGDSGNNTGRGVVLGFTSAYGTPAASPLGTTIPRCLVANWNYAGGSPGYVLTAGAIVADSNFDFVQNDVVGMAVNMDTGEVWVRKNGGAWIGGGDPADGTLPSLTYTGLGPMRPVLITYVRGATFTGDYRVRARVLGDVFQATPPTGYTAVRGYWSYQHTELSLHGEVVVDSSSLPKVLTNVGGATVSSAQSKFGSSALSLSGSQYLYTQRTNEVAYGAGPFTLEAWIYPTALGTVVRHIFTASEQVTASFAYTYFSLLSTGALQAHVQPATGGAGVVVTTAASAIPLSTWSYITLCREGGNVFMFINGVLVAGTSAWVDYPVLKSLYLGIGGIGNGYTDATVGRFQGYIDDLRVTKNAVRYMDGFAVPTAAFPNNLAGDDSFASVVLLTHFDGADGSTTVTDSSSYARACTVSNAVAGSARLSTGKSKFGTASLYVSNQTFGAWQVFWAASTDFNISANDFTIEMWAYEISGVGSLQSLISRRTGGSATGWALTTYSLRAKINGVWSDTQMGWVNPPQDAWHHYAFVRKGSILMMFIDGKLVAAKHGVTSMEDLGAVSVYLGQSDHASENKFYGYFDDLRWTKGVARYSADFTPHARTHPDRGPAV